MKRHSVFVGNLPHDATSAQLEAAFKRFGPIKRNGIQVRSSKVVSLSTYLHVNSVVLDFSTFLVHGFLLCPFQGSCYGFVEFESESSMHAALEVISKMLSLLKEQFINRINI